VAALYRHLRQRVLANPNTPMARHLLVAERRSDTLFILVTQHEYKTYTAAQAKKWFADPR